jgi:alcohol dehydrogenase
MKALVYHGPGKKSLEDVPMPRLLESCDAIVKVTNTTICGTDLHILKGDVPEVARGRVLGHEGVGVVHAVGPGVTNIEVGQAVLISCITACGRCGYYRRGMYSHCEDGGWQLGHHIDGTQAEFVRIPYADTSLHVISSGGAQEHLVMLSDVLPTSYECGILSGCLKPNQTVAIVGAGPIGLGAVMTAKLFSPAQLIVVDTDDNRLELARALGATAVVDNEDGAAANEILDETDGRGVDLAIEAVGIPSTLELCQAVVAPGGHIANIGVHGKPVSLNMPRLWSHNITLTTRLVDTISTPELLQAVNRGVLHPARLITHRFTLSNILEAYEVFAGASESRSLKTIITP